MDSLSASTGDVIEIRGKRRTVAKCLPLYLSDEGKGIVRVDGLVRNNAGVAIGDTVVVRKVKAVPAEKVIVAPLEAIPPIDERYLADALESVPLIKGDNVMVPYFGGRLTFQVIGVTPAADAVLVTQKTIFHIAERDSALRGGTAQVAYEDIGGLKEEIQKVREMIELPLRHPEIFEKLGIEAPKGILLHGPPGTGKTLLAKAVASESNSHFISISGPEIMSKFYGESEARLREIFKEAKEKAPSIIFIDEIDSLAPKREEVTGEVERRVVSQLLTLMDGLKKRGKVIVIAATNRPNSIDEALRRGGRFDREIEIPVPVSNGRLEIPKVKWSDIGGLERVKQSLKEMVEWPLKNPDSFDRLGIKPPRGILLYGPPGTGKTLLAQAVANESGANFISVKGPELLSKWVGESEKLIRDLFKRAKQVAPCIIFFDEMDSLAPRRGAYSGSHATESVVSQLFTEMSGLEELNGVVVVAASNRPDMVDPALLRPGRLDRMLMVPSPDEKSRLEILKIHTRSMPLKNVDLKDLVDNTEGFSGADIESLCREAAMAALRENMKSKEVTKQNFEEALKKVSPSITKEILRFYENFLARQRRIEKAEEIPVSYIG